jgi:D-alanyl-D-alanine carboxypeptidase
MSFLKRDDGPKCAPFVPVLMLCVMTAMLFVPAQAQARRRYFRERYAPPASAMAIDLHTGRILYSKNATEPRYPASLTKVMTLYLLFDALRDGKLSMKSELRVSAHAADQSPTKLDLSEGDTISVADAVGAIVTKSANDMAVTIAEALAGSEDEFARRMTQKARTIGMLNTTFRNASGLPDPEQKTTAQDLIVLGKNILTDHPERSRVFATKYFQYDGQVFRNHNTLLFSYEGMEGMKTGFTSASGFNLIASARRGDKRLLAVVLGGHSSGSRNAAMRYILDSSWPKALTQVAARKAGIQIASAKPKAEEPIFQKNPRDAAVPVRPIGIPAVVSGPVWPLRRKPDRASISMLLASIEAAVVSNSASRRSSGSAAAAADMTTDEPDDKAEKVSRESPSYAPPAPQDIARNETLVAQVSSPSPANVSVHYKTVVLPEVVPLAAAALDGLSEMQPVQPAQVIRAVEKQQDGHPQTLAAATLARSQEMAQPGPFHVQVGAFADQSQAEQRLESVKQTLGPAILKAHPEFIMPVSLPTGVTMFRARLSRFADEAQAKSTCRRLKSSGIECWDIRAQ